MELQVTSIHLKRGAAHILNDVTVHFTTGQCYGLVGPNGAGKTSLLRCMAGSIHPQQGQILLGDRTLNSWSAAELKSNIAYLPQHTPNTFSFTVEEYVSLSGASLETINTVLNDLELTSKASSPLQALSGGERQRASLARVFAQQSRFILLDEPFAHLDQRHQLSLLKYFQRRALAGQCIIVVIHDLVLAHTYFRNLCLIDSGRVIATGPPEEVLSQESLTNTFEIQWDSQGHLAELGRGA